MNPDSKSEIRSLASGVRAVATVFVLILSFFNVRLAFKISHSERIFQELLGGRPLPRVTEFVLEYKTIFTFLSLLVPIAAIAAAFILRSHRNALFALSFLMIVAFVEMNFVWDALFATFHVIIAGMGGS